MQLLTDQGQRSAGPGGRGDVSIGLYRGSQRPIAERLAVTSPTYARACVSWPFRTGGGSAVNFRIRLGLRDQVRGPAC